MPIQSILNNKLLVAYNLSSKTVSVSGLNGSNGSENKAASLLDKYYTDGLCKRWGVGWWIALFELVPALMLWRFIGSPATKTNFFTSCGEFLQILLGSTTAFGNPNIDRDELNKLPAAKRNELMEKSKNAQERREGAMSIIQILAGVLGLTSFGLEKSGKAAEVEDLPLLKRMGLSIASLFSAVFMISGYFEKGLMTTIASKMKGSVEHNNMRMNKSSDLRCFGEWISMTFLPWIPKWAKTIIDFVIPVHAIREGLSQIAEDGHLSLVFSKSKLQLSKKIIDRLKTMLFLGEKSSSMPPFIASNFFLSKIRDSIFIPVLNFFKAKPPICYLRENNLLCELQNGNGSCAPASSGKDLCC